MQEFRHLALPDEVADWVALHYTEGQLQALGVNDTLDSPLLDYKGGNYRDINTYLRMGVEDLQKEDRTNSSITPSALEKATSLGLSLLF